MPNMFLYPWSNIVQLIPVDNHAEIVFSSKWQHHFAKANLQNQHTAIFSGNKFIQLSRDRLLNFPYTSLEQKCMEILLWGYPNGGRKNLHVHYLNNITSIATQISTAKKNNHLTWAIFYHQFKSIGNLGISTITKLAYFFDFKFDSTSALILDQRLIKVFHNGNWTGFSIPGITYSNAHKHYLNYLKILNQASQTLGCNPDQIELLLFSHGKNFI